MELVISNARGFAKKNAVMLIAFAAALITSLFVPVDKEYIGYFDFKTLSCLFCVLAVVCALKDINFFFVYSAQNSALFQNGAHEHTCACVYNVHRLYAHCQ